MRVNMSRWLTVVAFMAIIGCSAASSEDETYGSGFVVVSEWSWGIDNTTPYPFTVLESEISCGSHPEFGREVYFDPVGYTDESNIGTPLNKAAVDSLNQSDMSSNVPYSIKEGADLSEVIQIGLKVCDEFENQLASN